jgi:hypothetical protein
MQLASGKVGFHFLQTNIYLLGNDSSNGIENKSVKELLYSSGVYNNTPGINTNNNSSSIVVCLHNLVYFNYFITYFINFYKYLEIYNSWNVFKNV